MSFRSWVIKALGGQETQTASANDVNVKEITPPLAQAAADTTEEEAAGLNFRTAIETHQKWKTRLKAVIDSDAAEAISVETLSSDTHCVLGQWIYGSGGQQYGNLSDFERLKHNHTHFHRCAGQVLSLAQNGHKQEAAHALNHGDYARVSQEVVMDLAKLYTTVAEK